MGELTLDSISWSMNVILNDLFYSTQKIVPRDCRKSCSRIAHCVRDDELASMQQRAACVDNIMINVNLE